METKNNFSFKAGYQTALEEILEDLMIMHEIEKENSDTRKIIDQIWFLTKSRLVHSKTGKS